MTPRRFLPTASVLLWLLISLRITTLAEEPGRFAGEIPEPPHQRDPWTPPVSTLPKFLVNATTTLNDQGLADPRGGDYRTVEVVTDTVWGGGGRIVKQRGWVFADPNGGPTRFIVGWDGLIWPTVTVGDPADLAADVARLVTRSQSSPGKFPGRFQGLTQQAGQDAHQPETLIGPGESNPLQVCLLLRLGRADLAESIWAALTKQTDAAPGRPSRSYPYSYLTMANDLAWSHFERAATAIKRGDDNIVLHDARVLTRLQAGVERTARALGFPHPDRGSRDQPSLYISFLHQLPILLADAERRTREPQRPPIPPPGGPDPSARVAALIQDLDQIVVNQMSQPGGVSLGEAATVQALIAEGDAAVEPLIAALRHDDRLTRSVSFWRDFARSRTFLTTYDAAYAALSGILRTTTFAVASTSANLSNQGEASRAEVADRIEAYWNRYKAFPLVERWYQTLANDQANPESWVDAAGNITQPDNVQIVPGGTAFTTTVTTERQPGEVPRVRGDSLRIGHEPTVTALMIKRIESSLSGPDSSAATALVNRLLAWDSAAALPTVQAVWKRLRAEYFPPQNQGDWLWRNQFTTLAHLAAERIQLGDATAASEYTALIRPSQPAWFDHETLDAFEPLYRFPDDPVLRETAEWIFNDPASRWSNPFEAERRAGLEDRSNLIASALIRVPAWRRALERLMGDPTEYATARLIRNNPPNTGYQFKMRTKSGSESGYGFSKVDDQAPAPDVEIVVRIADQVASELAGLDGSPSFACYWPLAQREAAIGSIRAYLHRYGDHFVAKRPSRRLLPFEPRDKSVFLAFPRLDHPATRAEVAEGRAIFTLEPTDGPLPDRRVVPLVEHPIQAQWVPPGLPPEPADYRPDEHMGRVWQAEEVLEGGRWQRYFGFVGNRGIERVTAAELIFPGHYGGATPDPSGWEVRYQGPLLAPGTPPIGFSQPRPDLPVGHPLRVSFTFRNQAGLDQSLPQDLVRQRDGKVVALAKRLHLDLRWAAPMKLDPRQPITFMNGINPQGDEDYHRVELKPEVARSDTAEPRQDLGPGATAEPVELDLRDLFTIDQPGRYRFRVQYGDDPEPAILHWKSLEFIIVSPEEP